MQRQAITILCKYLILLLICVIVLPSANQYHLISRCVFYLVFFFLTDPCSTYNTIQITDHLM